MLDMQGEIIFSEFGCVVNQGCDTSGTSCLNTVILASEYYDARAHLENIVTRLCQGKPRKHSVGYYHVIEDLSAYSLILPTKICPHEMKRGD